MQNSTSSLCRVSISTSTHHTFHILESVPTLSGGSQYSYNRYSSIIRLKSCVADVVRIPSLYLPYFVCLLAANAPREIASVVRLSESGFGYEDGIQNYVADAELQDVRIYTTTVPVIFFHLHSLMYPGFRSVHCRSCKSCHPVQARRTHSALTSRLIFSPTTVNIPHSISTHHPSHLINRPLHRESFPIFFPSLRQSSSSNCQSQDYQVCFITIPVILVRICSRTSSRRRSLRWSSRESCQRSHPLRVHPTLT